MTMKKKVTIIIQKVAIGNRSIIYSPPGIVLLFAPTKRRINPKNMTIKG